MNQETKILLFVFVPKISISNIFVQVEDGRVGHMQVVSSLKLGFEIVLHSILGQLKQLIDCLNIALVKIPIFIIENLLFGKYIWCFIFFIFWGDNCFD